ncbi:MAG TPA: HupE/UreJ family protein [Casimicrobiaceae bacterium]|nr:HupE/UreJ family protein [Casimicrobiaceae bacterium]
MGCSLRAYFWSIILLAALAFPRSAIANGSDLPPEIVFQGFVKPEDGRVQLLVRLPLVLLSSFSLPKRGPGYLDLEHVDAKLKQAAAATGRLIELSADGAMLVPTTREVRLSLLSDRSFASYSSALAHLQGPSLPVATDLFWNQGFFDLQLEYVLQSPRPNIWIRVNVAPELGRRIKLRLEYLPIDESARTYEIPGASGWIPLHPRWYEAAWLFAKAGLVDAFAIDRFVFLLCLIAPFRKLRSLLPVVIVLAALQALTLTAAAEGALADIDVGWLAVLSDTVLAAGMVLLAIGNLAAPSLRRRWFIAAVVGALGGFGLGRLLTDAWQFAGTHTLVAVVSFNVGVALGEVVSLVLAFFALRLLFAAVLGPLLGVIVLSTVAGHASWHGMIDGGRELWRQLGQAGASGFWSALIVVAPWLAPALLVGVVAYLLPKRFDGVPAPTLLRALLGQRTDDGPERA